MPREFNPPKRKAHDISDDARAPSRKRIHLQAAARENPNNKYPSVNELKRRIRDVKRLLKRADLPADARIVQERALAGYEKDLADETRRRDRSKVIKKYHFVRFLDRKTASKEVSRLTKQKETLAKSSDLDAKAKEKKLAALDSKLHVGRVNLNYTMYYPLHEKYISLYAVKNEKDETKEGEVDSDGGETQLTEESAAGKKAMWRTVEKCMEDGTLDLLRDGKLGANENAAASQSKKRSGDKARPSAESAGKSKERSEKSSVKSDKTDVRRGNTHKQPTTQEVDNGDESDGGFFDI
ncbi:hypothetical protein ARAM_004393 [Aspergillus rambellii]|uniref:rRNA-processing protein EFG1 n=1 Tax=Aspergillus rambellii TaxID=308745 RepID=A0A0F8WMV8_9EURO|nr:hypothetical protein ARAM_004393 [Aspergillus rambellii]